MTQNNRLKLGKNSANATLNFQSNVGNDFDDETSFQQKLLLTDTQVSRHCKSIKKPTA